MARYKMHLPHAASWRGADLGRRNELPESRDAAPRLHLNLIPMNDGGAYDRWGAYWGVGNKKTGFMYCAESGDDASPAESCIVFVRATSRADAKAQVKALIPNARFYR